MATNSKIEWTDHTGNLWWGCTKVGEGCVNCYAATLAKRWGKDVWDNEVREYKKQVHKDLPKWQKEAEQSGGYRRVFVGSMMDIFEKPMSLIDSKGTPLINLWDKYRGPMTTEHLRQDFFQRIVPKHPNLMFLLLTKRPSNINKYIPGSWKDNPPENVMYGATVACQQDAVDVARHFDKVNGPKFLSIEPLIEEVNMSPFETWYDGPLPLVDWVIVGGESGHNKRPFDPDWARKIRDWCKETETPFFMKQWDKVREIPGDLMIREFPDCHEFN
jgi:protein gp37